MHSPPVVVVGRSAPHDVVDNVRQTDEGGEPHQIPAEQDHCFHEEGCETASEVPPGRRFTSNGVAVRFAGDSALEAQVAGF